MSNKERQRQDGQGQEAVAEGLQERFRKAMDAVAEQGKRISAIIKERAKDKDLREYFNNRHIRKYVRAAAVSLVLASSGFGIKSFFRRERTHDIEPRPAIEAGIEQEESESYKPKTVNKESSEKEIAEEKAEILEEFEKEAKEEEVETEKQRIELLKKFEEFEREELEREIRGLESGAEETSGKKESEEEKSALEESVPPEPPKISVVAKEIAPQENVDDEMSKLDERSIVEAFDFFMKNSPEHKGSTVVKMKENCLAVDLGRYDDYHCYKVTPADLAQLRKAQEDYQAKIYKYILNRRPTRFSPLASEKLRRSYKEEAKIKIKNILDKYCEKIDEVSPEQVPEEIINAQQERQKKKRNY